MESRIMGPRAGALAAAMCAGLAGAAAAQDEEGRDPESAGVAACEALRDEVIDAGHVTSARVVRASQDGPYGALPDYCEVRATALPAISIELRLPLEGEGRQGWNGKLYQTGCGGFCGILGRADAQGGFINAMGPGLARGYATATSDSGHHGLSVVDATWAQENPQAERDWGWRSIGETNRVAQAMIEAFYGRGAEPAYFQGCSTGGRMANRAALTYPEMFDGIISGAPAMDYTGLVATKMAYLLQANTGEDGSALLGPDDAALIGDEVMAQCDAADGAEDGAIADPRACEVDLAPLACGDGPDEGCLTEAEAAALDAWRAGPRDAAGEQLYPGGVPEGSEPFWPLWLTGTTEGAPPLLAAFTTAFGAHMAFAEDPGALYDPLDFDLESDPARLAPMSEVYERRRPRPGRVRRGGGPDDRLARLGRRAGDAGEDRRVARGRGRDDGRGGPRRGRAALHDPGDGPLRPPARPGRSHAGRPRPPVGARGVGRGGDPARGHPRRALTAPSGPRPAIGAEGPRHGRRADA